MTRARPVLVRRVVAVALALIVPFAVIVYASAREGRHAPVYAVDAHGLVLRSGSQVRAGQHLTVYADGFARSAPVQVVDAARRRVHYVRADANGTARTSFVVPREMARRHPPFVALDGAIAEPAAPGVPSGSGQSGRPQSVQVSVPLLREFAYRLPRSGVDAGGVGLGSGTHTGTEGHGSGPLADTGFDELALLIAGIVLITLGAGALRAQRGRSTEAHQ